MGRGNIGPGREKNISGGSGRVERHGNGLGTGPVGNSGGFGGRPSAGMGSGGNGRSQAGGSQRGGIGSSLAGGSQRGGIGSSLAGMALGTALGKTGNSSGRKKPDVSEGSSGSFLFCCF